MKQWIGIPIISAMIGFIVSILLLTCNSRNDKSVFTEVVMDNKSEILTAFICHRISLAESLYKKIKLDIEHLRILDNQASKAELTFKDDTLHRVIQLIKNSNKELALLRYGNIDTAVGYAQPYFSINRAILQTALDSIHTAAQIPIQLTDTSTILAELYSTTNYNLKIKVKNDFTIMNFISKYSSFGLWLFFSIAQMSIWFLLCPIMIGSAVASETWNWKLFICNLILPVVAISFFLIFVFKYLNDYFIIKDAFVLSEFSSRMKWYSSFGYSAAAICFGMYLYASQKFDELNNDKTLKGFAAAGNGLNTKTEKYHSLESLFENAFICSAVILTVFVLWVGILFTSINSTEIMRYYQLLSGSSFLNADIVYLLGLTHTLLLLIFYIPVRLKFNSLKVVQDTNAATSNNDKKIWGFLSESLGTILLTTSPLIVSLIQKAISNFIQ